MKETLSVPRYTELPQIPQLGIPTSWDIFPNSLGTLNFIDRGTIKETAHRVGTGQVFPLSIDSNLLDPPLYGRSATEHTVIETTRNILEDELNLFNPQAGSQWDGLCHIRAREFGFYGGITDQTQARDALGIHHVASHGIVGRGVLVDVAGYYGDQWDPMQERAVGPDEVRAILSAQGTSLQEGDILCLRFGWIAEYRSRKTRGADITKTGLVFAGLSAANDLVEYLWNSRVAAVATDNPGVESSPGNKITGSLHRKLIPGLGYPLAELLDFEELAAACHKKGSYEFLFTAAPLPIHGGVSSTANALAIL